MDYKISLWYFPWEGITQIQKIGFFENRIVLQFWKRQLYINRAIFDSFVFSDSHKKVAIFGTTLETMFFCKNRYKTVKNPPISI